MSVSWHYWADIEIEGVPARSVKGGHTLEGAPVMASDLPVPRLVIAGLAARGTTPSQSGVYHIIGE